MLGIFKKFYDICRNKSKKVSMPRKNQKFYSPQDLEFKLLSNKLVDILLKMDNPIAKKLIELNQGKYENDCSRNISLNVNNLKMRYCPKDSDTVLNAEGTKWKQDNRQEGRWGRVLKKVLDEQAPEFTYGNQVLEELVSMLKSFVSDSEFEVVSGWGIADAYAEQDERLETLFYSCMQGKPREWFKLFADNPDVIEMIILRKKCGLMIGRALLWTFDGKKWMDGVYGSSDTCQIFKDYAKEQGFEDRIPYENKVKIPVVSSDYEFYNRTDTFRYLGKDFLTNDRETDWIWDLTHLEGEAYLNTSYSRCLISNEPLKKDEMVQHDLLGGLVNPKLIEDEEIFAELKLIEESIV